MIRPILTGAPAKRSWILSTALSQNKQRNSLLFVYELILIISYQFNKKYDLNTVLDVECCAQTEEVGV